MPTPYRWIQPSLATLHKANWHRRVLPIQGMTGPVVTIQGRQMVNLASNDYLGFAGEPQLMERAIAAIQTYGTGATGSRLLSGHRDLHLELEAAIAQLKGTEAAIVFSSGYLANLGTITAIVNHRDLILADEYNHSSLKNGAALSGAHALSYRHCDIKDLEDKLQQHRATYRRALILTDAVFGMDGDACPLLQILDLADNFDAMVMIDEAHSAGVLGERGAGCAEHFGCSHRPMIQMGTLSKAFASLGGYVAGSAELIDFLRNRAPSWIYTTGLSPADTAAALGAIAQLNQELTQQPNRLTQLHQNARYLSQQLDCLLAELLTELPSVQMQYLKRLPTDSAIVCLQVKDAATVLALNHQLKEQGIFVSAVRPPTVPISRLRMSVMATHTTAQLDRCVAALRQCLSQPQKVSLHGDTSDPKPIEI
ncbi:MAG: 8-amino-7-oxononanoate synthase [Cyanobacteria bacterium J06627_32]